SSALTQTARPLRQSVTPVSSSSSPASRLLPCYFGSGASATCIETLRGRRLDLPRRRVPIAHVTADAITPATPRRNCLTPPPAPVCSAVEPDREVRLVL